MRIISDIVSIIAHLEGSILSIKGFSLAVSVAAMLAKKGQSVLLSPASASFDEFASYEERGDTFVQIVHTLANKHEEREKENAAVLTSETEEIVKEIDENSATESASVKQREDDEGLAIFERFEPTE